MTDIQESKMLFPKTYKTKFKKISNLVLCVLVLCTQVNDVCDVTLSVHPHRAG